MPKPAIVFAGFSMPKYVEEAKALFPADSYEFVCVHGREADENRRSNYLPLFDHTYSVDSIPTDLPGRAFLVTCTQERDMNTYLRTLRTVDFIDSEQFDLWSRAINKRLFKEKMRAIRPELVPQVSAYDPNTPIRFPAVIKPANLTGSAFVQIVRDQTELDAYKQRLGKYLSSIKKLGREPELVVEEFVSGEQYSMNVYIDQEGRITFCPLIRVVPAFELGHDDTYSALQYNTALPDDLMLSLQEAIAAVASVFRIRRTSAHFDCILSPAGWKICEVGLRIGGNRQPLFLESHGFSHFKNDLYNRIGRKVALGERRATVAIVQKAPDHHGHLTSIHYPESADSGVRLRIDKQKAPDPEAGPVGQGGVTAFRAFLNGKDERAVVRSAEKLFEDTAFEMAEPYRTQSS